MNALNLGLVLVAVVLTTMVCPPRGAAASEHALARFQARAAKFGHVVSLPVFETTPEQIHAARAAAIAEGNVALDRIGRLAPREMTFANTVRALDDLVYAAGTVANRLWTIKETSPDAALREAATDAIKQLEEWMVGLDYREDVYRAVRAYADRRPRLRGEDAKLLEETLRSYRRAGLHLPPAERQEVERLRKEMTRLVTDFQSNITQTKFPLALTRAELEGVPDDFLQQIKTGEDEYTVQVHVTWHYLAVMDNARREDVRRRVLVARDNLAREPNLPLLEQVLVLRDQTARKLGYPTWADYQTEVKMARNAATARAFLEQLRDGLQPKFEAELAAMRALKVAETGDPAAQIHIWDWRYYANQLKKQKYDVDAEALRVYFPYQAVLDGMFRIYQHIFRLRFERVEPPYKWVDDLQLYAVSDAKTGEPLGLFYLDMFPREGKYNHFAQFGLIEGKRRVDGRYQRPVVALVCNFPPPAADKPSLLTHADVETLFHEFGHAMHSILTRANYARFSGTSVPRDFVEAPSQMLEYWVWDKTVLDSFAADYRDPAKKIPAEILGRLKEAKLATEATRYRRQLSFGLLDLTLHTQIHRENAHEVLPLSNRVLSEVFLPMAPDTAFVAFFGHLMGYDAAYYGYAWADAIAADMATVFERSPKGYQDARAGFKLRREIYEPGDSRDVNVSIRRFLGRERSLQPFFKQIGMVSD